jgi:hypothetical protein
MKKWYGEEAGILVPVAAYGFAIVKNRGFKGRQRAHWLPGPLHGSQSERVLASRCCSVRSGFAARCAAFSAPATGRSCSGDGRSGSGQQAVRDPLVDRHAVDAEPFREDVGFRRLNRIFEGRLEGTIGEIHDSDWRDTG